MPNELKWLEQHDTGQNLAYEMIKQVSRITKETCILYQINVLLLRTLQAFFSSFVTPARARPFKLREPRGHTLMQRIQAMHLSMFVLLGLSEEMAPTGQLLAQIPHPVQLLSAAGYMGRPLDCL